MVGSALFTRGDTIDRFTITEVITPHGHVERYHAAPKNNPGRRVIIACARRSASSPVTSEIARILLILRGIAEEGAPKVLAGGVLDTKGCAWLVHEHVGGLISLADYLAEPRECRGALEAYRRILQTDPERARYLLALTIGHGVANTLETYAEHGVVHGGVDPYDGIMLKESGEPVVFGLGYHQIFGLDSSGGMLGDPAFWAPEPITWKSPDPRIDIYSLGALLYWIALGKLPVEGRPPMGAMIKHTEAAWMSVAIERAIERDRARRFESWAAFTKLWDSLANGILAKADQMKAAAPPSGAASGSDPRLPQSGLREVQAKQDEITDRCPAPDFDDPVNSPARSAAPPVEIVNAAPTPRVPEMPVWPPSAPDSSPIVATNVEPVVQSSGIEVDVVIPIDSVAPARQDALALTQPDAVAPALASTGDFGVSRVVPSRRTSFRTAFRAAGLVVIAGASIIAALWTILMPRPSAQIAVGIFRAPLPMPVVLNEPGDDGDSSNTPPVKPTVARSDQRQRASRGPEEPSNVEKKPEYPRYVESCAGWAHCGRGKSRGKSSKPNR